MPWTAVADRRAAGRRTARSSSSRSCRLRRRRRPGRDARRPGRRDAAHGAAPATETVSRQASYRAPERRAGDRPTPLPARAPPGPTAAPERRPASRPSDGHAERAHAQHPLAAGAGRRPRPRADRPRDRAWDADVVAAAGGRPVPPPQPRHRPARRASPSRLGMEVAFGLNVNPGRASIGVATLSRFPIVDADATPTCRRPEHPSETAARACSAPSIQVGGDRRQRLQHPPAAPVLRRPASCARCAAVARHVRAPTRTR